MSTYDPEQIMAFLGDLFTDLPEFRTRTLDLVANLRIATPWIDTFQDIDTGHPRLQRLPFRKRLHRETLFGVELVSIRPHLNNQDNGWIATAHPAVTKLPACKKSPIPLSSGDIDDFKHVWDDHLTELGWLLLEEDHRTIATRLLERK